VAGLDLTTAEQVLKIDYQDLRSSLNNSFFLLTQIEKNTKDVQGKHAVHTVHLSRSSGIGSRQTGEALPNPSQQGYRQVKVLRRKHFGIIRIERDVIAAMRSDKGSFVRAVEGEVNGIEKDLRRDVNRQLWGTSDGVIATCGTTSNSATVVLASTTTRTQLRQLWNQGGMVVDIGTTSDYDTVASGRTVTAVDYTNKTITISGATVTTDSTHRVSRTGNGGHQTTNAAEDPDGQKELTGLQTIVDSSGVLHTVSASTYPQWAAGEFTASANRPPSENVINAAIQDQEIECGDQIGLLLSGAGVSRAVVNQLQAQRRNVNTIEVEGGYGKEGIKWTVAGEGSGPTGKPRMLVWEQDCPENTLFGLRTEELVKYEMGDWEWDDMGNGSVLKWRNGHDQLEAYYAAYFELACKVRNAHFKITQLDQA